MLLHVTAVIDSAISKYLKQRGMFCLQKKFIIDDIHLLALFLNPKFKALVPLSTSSRVKVHVQAQNLLVAVTSQITHDDDCAQCAVVVDPNSDHEYSNLLKSEELLLRLTWMMSLKIGLMILQLQMMMKFFDIFHVRLIKSWI